MRTRTFLVSILLAAGVLSMASCAGGNGMLPAANSRSSMDIVIPVGQSSTPTPPPAQ